MTETLAALVAELNAASLALKDADAAYWEAGSIRASCTNRVNEAQRMFDAEVAAMKKAAPNGSGWRTPKGEPA